MVTMKKISIYVVIHVQLSPAMEIIADENRKVILTETPDGHSFHFMPMDENESSDITITIAWPMSWAYDASRNPAVPYVAAESILSGGTKELAPQDVLGISLFNDKNASGQLYVSALTTQSVS